MFSRLAHMVRMELGGFRPRLRLVNLVVFLLPYHTFTRLRTALYRLAGVRIGKHSALMGRIEFGSTRPLSNLRIGDHCVLNAPVFFDLNATIDIGRHVHVGHHTCIVTAEHEIGTADRRGGSLTPGAVVLEDGCMIGAMVTILPGVTIGAGAIVATGAVVSASVPPNKLVAGNPARIIKTLPDDAAA